MNARGRRGLTGGLAVAVALLLVGGAVAAVTAGGRSPVAVVAGDGTVGAAGLGLQGVENPTEVAPTTVVAPLMPHPTTVTVPVVAPTVTTRPVTTSTSITAPPGVVPLPDGPVTLPPVGGPWLPFPTTTVPKIPPASSWSAEGDGIAVQMRMEPATPVAGETVRFSIDITTNRDCCTIIVDYGDGPPPMTGCGNCTVSSTGTIVATHTYAAAGSYKGQLIVVSLPSSKPATTLPGSPLVPPAIYGAGVTTCIGVGPGPAAKAPC